jgi:citrate lyase beta subunit
MKHFDYENECWKNEVFLKKPEPFTKYADKEILACALGATLYMPAVKNSIARDVIEKKFPELTSMVIDLEDAVGNEQVIEAEKMAVSHISKIYSAIDEQVVTIDELPLIFIRVRNPEQLRRISDVLGIFQRVLTGYVFPKFSCDNGKEYLEILQTNNRSDLVLYGMPILETPEIMYKESRIDTLLKIKELVDTYKNYILNIRIGATDFCGLFGIRRKVDTTIYDVSVIRDCITDIINLFNRQNDGYVISGPVWEFFSNEQRILKPKLRVSPFQNRYGKTGLEKRTELINQYIDGLINEVILDKLNGLIGKTIIHPTHIKPVNSLYTVTHEEYADALSIMANSKGQVGVLKSQYENKMNEMKPHHYWAKQIFLRAKVFGVFNSEYEFTSLLMERDIEEMHEV